MFGVEKATKTDATKEEYSYRSTLLAKRCQRETGLDVRQNLELFCDWFKQLASTISQSTLRFYRAALLHEFEPPGLLRYRRMIEEIDSSCAKPKAKNPKASELKTSAQKRRSVPVDDLRKLATAFKQKKDAGYWLNIGVAIFAFTYHLGLRPIEWHGASLVRIANQPWLRVRNAKAGNGRTHGVYRHISLSQLDRGTIDAVAVTIAICADSRDAHGRKLPPEEFRARFSAAFSKFACSVLGKQKRKIMIYSARHQFGANIKKAGYMRKEIAALMGHASDSTVFRHYLPGRWGHTGGKLPLSIQEEVERVRQVAKPNPHTSKTMCTTRISLPALGR